MKEQYKQRIVGSLVLVAILAIFLPVLFYNKQPTQTLIPKTMPVAPAVSVVNLQAPAPLATPKPTAAALPVSPASPTPASTPTATPPAAPPAVLKQNYSIHQALDTPQAFVIQLVTLSNAAAANRFTQSLRKEGFDAYYRSIQSGRKGMYRVFVGPEISYDRAVEISGQLEKKLHLKGLVRKYELV